MAHEFYVIEFEKAQVGASIHVRDNFDDAGWVAETFPEEKYGKLVNIKKVKRDNLSA